MKSGFSVRVIRDTKNPYEFREEGPDRFALYEGQDKIDDICFPYPKNWSEEPEKEPRTSKGTLVTSLVSLKRRCFEIVPVRYCEYFINGTQCKFCNFTEVAEGVAARDARGPVALNLEETIEAYKIITSPMPPLIEGRLIMGAVSNTEAETRIYLQFVEKLASATPYLPTIHLSTQPMSRQDLQRFKDGGLACINMDIEVWHPQLFDEICPGKSKNRGRERYLEAYQEAVEILGWGSVGTNMPGGLTLMPENGLKTWQEARNSHDEGNRWLIQRGVIPMFQPLTLGTARYTGTIQPTGRNGRPQSTI